MAVKPITPEEVINVKETILPDEVITVFNELIAKNWKHGSATIRRCDVAKIIRKRMNLKSDELIYENHWLDVEDIYRKNGWKVVFEFPSYDETNYEPYFVFSKKDQR